MLGGSGGTVVEPCSLGWGLGTSVLGETPAPPAGPSGFPPVYQGLGPLLPSLQALPGVHGICGPAASAGVGWAFWSFVCGFDGVAVGGRRLILEFGVMGRGPPGAVQPGILNTLIFWAWYGNSQEFPCCLGMCVPCLEPGRPHGPWPPAHPWGQLGQAGGMGVLDCQAFQARVSGQNASLRHRSRVGRPSGRLHQWLGLGDGQARVSSREQGDGGPKTAVLSLPTPPGLGVGHLLGPPYAGVGGAVGEAWGSWRSWCCLEPGRQASPPPSLLLEVSPMPPCRGLHQASGRQAVLSPDPGPVPAAPRPVRSSGRHQGAARPHQEAGRHPPSPLAPWPWAAPYPVGLVAPASPAHSPPWVPADSAGCLPPAHPGSLPSLAWCLHQRTLFHEEGAFWLASLPEGPRWPCSAAQQQEVDGPAASLGSGQTRVRSSGRG